MIGWRQAFQGARRALGALVGGGAPRAFRRELVGTVAALGDLRRGTVWLRELVAVQPRLRSGPLFGGALAELTGYEPPADDGAAAPGARRGATGTAENAALARPGRPPLRPAPPSGTSRRDPAAPLTLAERADRDLLERLAIPAAARVATGAADAADTAKAAAPRAPSFPVPVPGSASGRAPNPAAEARWRREISQRAERAQRSGRAGDPEREARVRTARSAMGQVSGPPRVSLGAPALPGKNLDPWQTPLAGEKAPRAILDRFRSAGRVRPGAPASRARTERPETAAPEIHPDRRAASPRPAAAPTVRANAGPTWLGRLPHPASSAAAIEGDGVSRTPAADLAAATGPLLVPPPSLPPFLEVHAATEVALRRPAAEGPTGPGIPPRVPALLPEDDLAARIDRLLAEEARRHGIDV